MLLVQHRTTIPAVSHVSAGLLTDCELEPILSMSKVLTITPTLPIFECFSYTSLISFLINCFFSFFFGALNISGTLQASAKSVKVNQTVLQLRRLLRRRFAVSHCVGNAVMARPRFV